MSNQPVYRRPRSHAYSCRCPRCVQSMPKMKDGDYGIIGPLALFAGLVAVIGFWPAMAWHGQTDTGGWRWDIHSTMGCLIWWVFLAAVVILAWADSGHKRAKRAVRPPRGPLNVEAMPPPPPSMCVPRPVCLHLDAEPVNNMLDPDAPPWAWLCPECNAQLPAELGLLRRSCCGTAHGMFHRHNCPQAVKR